MGDPGYNGTGNGTRKSWARSLIGIGRVLPRLMISGGYVFGRNMDVLFLGSVAEISYYTNRSLD